VSRAFDATILRPYYPISDLYRVAAEDEALQIDFMATVHGMRPYNNVKSRAISVDVGGEKFLVASLPEINASKRAADSPRDRAVLDVLARTLKKQENVAPGKTQGTETGKCARARRSDPPALGQAAGPAHAFSAQAHRDWVYVSVKPLISWSARGNWKTRASAAFVICLSS
jgi:hypothetical protein